MCKLLILTSHNPAELPRIIDAAWSMFSATERDGYGAAWVGPDRTMRTARSYLPNLASVASLPDFADTFGQADELASDGGALILHGRTATCGISLANTHPMMVNDGATAVVHNGVVRSKSYQNKLTTCDSELLALAYAKGGVQEVARSIAGYYAFAALTVGKRSVTLDVARDGSAMLYCAPLASGGWAFGTTPELAASVGTGRPVRFKSCHAVRFEAPHGKRLVQSGPAAPFQPLREELTKAERKDAARALATSQGYRSAFEDTELGHTFGSTNWRGGGQ